MVRMHRIPLIGSLSKAKHKNQFWLEIDRYMEKLRQEATGDDLEMSAQNMQKYISGPIMANTMFHMLQD